jgi:peptidylprolyl isomerase
MSGALMGSIGSALAQNPPAARPGSGASTAAPARTQPAAPRAPTAADKADDEVVARIAGRDVTTSEVRSFLAGLGAEQQAALARDPALLSQTLRLMLANQLVLKEANEKKWQDQPEIAAQLARVRDNAVVESYLQAISVPPESYPEEAEIQKAYDANKTAFIVPRQFRIAQIFVSLPAGADKTAEDQARKKLTDVQARLKQPKADFAAIAKELSDQRETAERGGEIGWLSEAQIRPEIKAQVMGLANNGVSELIKLDDGWHIIRLIETRASETRPLADVRAFLVQRLRTQRTETLRRAYLARLLEQSPPAINELGLAKVFAPAAPATSSR